MSTDFVTVNLGTTTVTVSDPLEEPPVNESVAVFLSEVPSVLDATLSTTAVYSMMIVSDPPSVVLLLVMSPKFRVNEEPFDPIVGLVKIVPKDPFEGDKLFDQLIEDSPTRAIPEGNESRNEAFLATPSGKVKMTS